MAAYCLNVTPSQQSFEMIIAYNKTAPFGSQLSQNLGKATQTYMELQYLQILNSVLYATEDLEAIKVAAQLVDQAAVKILPELSSQQPTDEQDITALDRRKNDHYKLFEGFRSILESLSQSSSNQDVVYATTQALSHILEYLPTPVEEDTSIVSNI